MARPKKPIDVEQVIRLAAIQCSYAEMAAVLGCNESTLTRRFAQDIQTGRSTGRSSLKRKQYEMALNGNVTMLIWLGKQYLEQTDKVEQRTENVSSFRIGWADETDRPNAALSHTATEKDSGKPSKV